MSTLGRLIRAATSIFGTRINETNDENILGMLENKRLNNQINNSNNVNTAPITAGGDVKFVNVTINNKPKIEKYLTPNPFNADFFIGRNEDLNLIREKISKSNKPLLLVNGEGGIGKTSIAAKYWNQNQDAYHHLAWLYAGNTISNALLTLATPLGITFDSASDTEERVRIVIQVLSNLNKPSLLVLDNANDIDDLAKNYKKISSLPNIDVLLTSRINELDSFPYYKILPLDFDRCLELFKFHYKPVEDGDIHLLKNIFVAVGYNTLVVELLAKNLRFQNRIVDTISIEDLLNVLKQKGLFGVQTKAVPITYGSDELQYAKPENVIRALYNMAQLNIAQVEIMCNLSVLPPENISFSTLIQILDPSDKRIFEDNIFELYTKGWVDFNKSDNSFKISPVIQEVVKDKSRNRLFEYNKVLIINLKKIFSSRNTTELYLFYKYAESILHNIESNSKFITDLNLELANYYRDVGALPQALNYAKSSKSKFEKIGDTQSASACSRLIGQIYKDQGLVDLADEEFDNASKNFTKGQRIIQGKTLVHFGYINSEIDKANNQHIKGNSEQALKVFFKHFNYIENVLKRNPNDEELINTKGLLCQHIGDVYEKVGEIAKSIRYFKIMKECFENLNKWDKGNDDYLRGLSIANSRLGMLYRDGEQIDLAFEYFNDYYTVSKVLYEKDPLNQFGQQNLARAQDFLGRLYLNEDTKKAWSILKDSYDLCKRMFEASPTSESSQMGLSMAISRLGDYYMKIDDLDKAIKCYIEYKDMNERMLLKNPKSAILIHPVALAYKLLGQAYHSKRDLDNALKCFSKFNMHMKEAHRLNKVNIGYTDTLAFSYLHLGEVLRDLNLKEDAISNFLESYNIWIALSARAGIYRYSQCAARAQLEIKATE